MRNTENRPLVDIAMVRIDPALPGAERLRIFAETVGDPHHFRVGETPVEVIYSDHVPALQTVLTTLCQNLQ